MDAFAAFGVLSSVRMLVQKRAPPRLDGDACAEFFPVVDPAFEYPVDTLASLIGRLGGETEASIAAATELGKLGKSGALAAVQLAKCLKDRDEDVRKAAAGALEKLGGHAAPAVP